MLKKYGVFLSGRSTSQRILAEELCKDSSQVVLDFEGIVSCNQSFINELLLGLYRLGFEFKNMITLNANNRLEERVRIEISRLKSSLEATRGR